MLTSAAKKRKEKTDEVKSIIAVRFAYGCPLFAGESVALGYSERLLKEVGFAKKEKSRSYRPEKPIRRSGRRVLIISNRTLLSIKFSCRIEAKSPRRFAPISLLVYFRSFFKPVGLP